MGEVAVAGRPSSVLLIPQGLLPSLGIFPVASCLVPVVGGWSSLRQEVLFHPRRPCSTISCAFSSSWKLITSGCTSRGSGRSGSWRNIAFALSIVSKCCSSSFLPAACSLPLPQVSFPQDGSTAMGSMFMLVLVSLPSLPSRQALLRRPRHCRLRPFHPSLPVASMAIPSWTL